MLLRAQGFATQFEQYEMVSQLGEGGSGHVMLVRHKLTEEQFAMKVIEVEGVG